MAAMHGNVRQPKARLAIVSVLVTGRTTAIETLTENMSIRLTTDGSYLASSSMTIHASIVAANLGRGRMFGQTNGNRSQPQHSTTGGFANAPSVNMPGLNGNSWREGSNHMPKIVTGAFGIRLHNTLSFPAIRFS